jgi:hypothetical protein
MRLFFEGSQKTQGPRDQRNASRQPKRLCLHAWRVKGLSKKARRNFRRAQVRGVKNQKLNFAPSCSTRGSYVDVTFPKFGSAELVLTPKNWVWLKVLNDSNRN